MGGTPFFCGFERGILSPTRAFITNRCPLHVAKASSQCERNKHRLEAYASAWITTKQGSLAVAHSGNKVNSSHTEVHMLRGKSK